MTEQFIQAGIGAIAACGTTGEAAALLWEEKRDFVDTLVQVNRNRVPIFAGATALGTREVVRQMRALRDLGADGAFVGLPLWQTPTLENSVQWYADLGEAVPDLPIMIYANAMFFKSTFPTVFWEGIARRAPTVITAKVSYGIEHLREDLEVAGHQIIFQPGQREIFPAYQVVGSRITAAWSTSAAMGPEPLVALMDAILRDDAQRAGEVWNDIMSLPSASPPGEHALHFPEYNAQANRAFTNAAGYIKAGPTRAPYRDLPDNWRTQSELHAKAWAALREKYVRAVRTA
jgi:trans-o-hydroxybenzylidenepyruvate hydratase-aldolase